MAGVVKQYHQQAVQMLYEKNRFTKYVALAEEKTQVKREYLASGFLGLLSIYLIFGYGAELICNLIAFVYPALSSLKALETRRKEDDTRWLIYWVVFAIFSVIEFFSDILLSWVPFYFLAKLVFLIWCSAAIPYNGSDFIYAHFIRPRFLKNQSKIDKTMDKVADKITQLASDSGVKLD